MLGVVIVALALTGAMFVSYFAGIEAEEQDVIKYQYLADVSGQFDYDKTPTYVEFDPSSNYTGYYSEDTGEYFPIDDVDYEESGKPNFYKINLAPVTIQDGNIVLSDDQGDSPFAGGSTNVIFANESGGWYGTGATTVSLKSYLNSMNLSDEVTDITIKSLGSYSENDYGYTYNADWVVFTVKSKWDPPTGTNSHGLFVVTPGWMESGPSRAFNFLTEEATLPCLSVTIDMKSGFATLYTDNDCQVKMIAAVSLDDVTMSFGGNMQGTGPGESSYANFDDSVYFLAQHKDTSYLDPNYGVIMKDE